MTDPDRLAAIRRRNDKHRALSLEDWEMLYPVTLVTDIDFLLAELSRLQSELDRYRPEIDAGRERLRAGMESETG
jgi:hypothetical protein